MNGSLIGTIVCGGSLIAQNKIKSFNTPKNKDSEIAQKTFSEYGEKEKAESAERKIELAKSQKKIRIEIVNTGDWASYNQIC